MIETVANVDSILSQEVYCSHKSRGCRKTLLLSELEVRLVVYWLTPIQRATRVKLAVHRAQCPDHFAHIQRVQCQEHYCQLIL